jgi:nicotinamidase-related amidase
MAGRLRITVRYLAMHSTGPDDNVEANIAPVDEPYEIDLGAAALVLVDTWNRHTIRSHQEATERVMRERIAPLLPAARSAGLPLIYAPSPDVARRYEQWRRRFGAPHRARAADRPDGANAPPGPVDGARPWPPPELRQREGPYARYQRRPGETWPGWDGRLPWDAIAESIEPAPDDCVVATGQELHELLVERRSLFIFYAGFATNICVLHRDYGILAMGARGYLPILLRDCTVGIETRATLAGHLTTRLAIQDVERRYYSADSQDLLDSCRAIVANR